MDKDHIGKLVQEGSTQAGVQAAQRLAKKLMQDNGYGPTLHNACAATLSEFMSSARIDVPLTLGAGKLADRIRARGWNQIGVGDQQAGDVAVAKNNVHIFLVVRAIDGDTMIIADNQAPGPHRRKASGDPGLNHSPVAYFLRAQGAVAPDVEVPLNPMAAPPDANIFPQGDEDTNGLQEPFQDDGQQVK